VLGDDQVIIPKGGGRSTKLCGIKGASEGFITLSRRSANYCESQILLKKKRTEMRKEGEYKGQHGVDTHKGGDPLTGGSVPTKMKGSRREKTYQM